MDAYGNMLLIAMPGFVLLILIEELWGWLKYGETQPVIDTISSLTSGMTNILKATLGLTIVIFSYPWMLEHLQLINWEKGSFWPYIITFMFIDFAGYWTHRFQHRVNFFWNHHVIHHSSEEFNLPCALRQQVAVLTNIYTILLIPLAICGIPGNVLAVVAPIHLFSQFWYHTRYIGKLGFLEYILVTPSHHRVHHAMNDLYMDKNYSQIFIVWDRLFGTFQEELDTEPCVYGIRRPAGTWNPYIINFKHLWQLMKDAWNTSNVWDKIRIWFMPTGWRPADVEKSDPVFSIHKMSELKKYAPVYSKGFKAFSLIHISITFLLLSFLFFRFGEISEQKALQYGLILMAGIFGFTGLLDKKAYGLVSMLIVSAVVAGLSFYRGDWFGLNTFLAYGSTLVIGYFVVSSAAALWFYNYDLKKELQIVS